MSIIDRYILKEFFKYFFGALVIFSTLYMVVEMLSEIWRLKGASASLIWTYYALNIPTVFYRMTPPACLMATIFTISVMSRTNELVALFSAGVSLARISLPVIFGAFIVAGVTFWVSDQLIPPLSKKRNYILFVDIRKQPSLYYTVKTNKIWYRSKDLIYNIRTLNPDTKLAQYMTVYYFDPSWALSQIVQAKTAQYDKGLWKLTDGNVVVFEKGSNFPLSSTFKEKTITLNDTPEDIQGYEIHRDVMTVKDLMNANELKKYIRKNKEAGLDTTRYEVAFHSKFAFAFVSVVMSFLGIPFSVSKDRSGSFALNIGICMLFVFIYWMLVSVGMSLGTHNQVSPLTAAWLPNGLMLCVALFFLLRLKK